MTKNKKVIIACTTFIIAIAFVIITTLIVNINKENKVSMTNDNSSNISQIETIETEISQTEESFSQADTTISEIESITETEVTTENEITETSITSQISNISSTDIFNAVIEQLNTSDLCTITSSDISTDILTLSLEVSDENEELGSIPADYTIKYTNNSYELIAPECYGGYAGASIKKQLTEIGSIEVIKALEIALTSQTVIENSENFDDKGFLLSTLNYTVNEFSCSSEIISKDLEDGSSEQLIYSISK